MRWTCERARWLLAGLTDAAGGGELKAKAKTLCVSVSMWLGFVCFVLCEYASFQRNYEITSCPTPSAGTNTTTAPRFC
jgi:hypothetical protein